MDDAVAQLKRIIEGRRSIGKVTDERPDRALIEQVLESATWAPNHRLTEPWRFVVLAGQAREALGWFMGEQNAARYPAGRAEADIERRFGRAVAAMVDAVVPPTSD